MKIKFLGVCGKGLISRAIQWQTRSDISHTAVLNSDTMEVIEALAHIPGDPLYKRGRVVRRPLHAYQLDTECFIYESKNPAFLHHSAWALAESLVGVPYDYVGVFRFVSRKGHDFEDVQRWFCSEAATVVSRVGGDQVQHLPAWGVSPKLHAASSDHTIPRLTTVEEILDAS